MKYIINDVAAKAFRFAGVSVLDPKKLTEPIRAWNRWSKFDPQTTRIVFPGNGARDVQRHLGETWLSQWRTDEVPATRFWWPGEGNNPSAVVGRVLPTGAFDFQTTDVVIIDDVVSSGATVSKIRERNAVWMPKARWHIATWIKQRACRLRGFEDVLFGEEVGKNGLRVPVNSLSTLLDNAAVAKSYAERKFSQPEKFLAALEALR